MYISSNVIRESGIEFGTSGARGLVEQFSDNVCVAFTLSFVHTMKSSFYFDRVAIAIDNRPSSYRMAQSCIWALKSIGIQSEYCGIIPTPALANFSMTNSIPSIMVTGSHIPFDRNGLKFYRPDGEISKFDEKCILSANVSFFPIDVLPEANVEKNAEEKYIRRYTSIFDEKFLKGKKIGIYEHSSSGRDLYSTLFEELGAKVVQLERTDTFVPIDTEAVCETDRVKARLWSKYYHLDMIFSTDGDGDRPLVSDENGEWICGDILGTLCSQALCIDAISIPINCNSMIANYSAFNEVSLTKIGSPYVIERMQQLKHSYKKVAGFEANGGYLLGSDVLVNGKKLSALPTRDALLPALMLLKLVKERAMSISQLVASLPKRHTYSDRLKNIPSESSRNFIEQIINSPFQMLNRIGLKDECISHIDTTDGLRLFLSSGDIVHLRASGNAPELRCYTESDDVCKAKNLVDLVFSAFIS